LIGLATLDRAQVAEAIILAGKLGIVEERSLVGTSRAALNDGGADAQEVLD